MKYLLPTGLPNASKSNRPGYTNKPASGEASEIPIHPRSHIPISRLIRTWHQLC